MIQKLYDAYLRSRTVTTDSRQLTPGCLFFALKGEHFDGNAFVPQALEQGAAVCVTSDGRYRGDERCVVVNDVLAALQQLAAEHRRHLDIPVIGITGTNGKTTTKELVTAVLARRYRVSATKGNFNNHLGVPLTLLAIPQEAEIAVVEMGANHPGEIEQLCRIADPDCGLITNVGRAHLEGFGSFEGVVQTKTELYRYLGAKGSEKGVKGSERTKPVLFVNADSERLMHEAERLATIPGLRSVIPAYQPDNPAFVPSAIERTPLSPLTYGTGSDADVRGTLVRLEVGGRRSEGGGRRSEVASALQPPTSDFQLPPSDLQLPPSPYLHFYFEVGDNVYNVRTHLLGAYNLDNCLAATAVGLHFGVEPFDIKEAIEAYVPSNNRSQYKRTERNELYLDCYNANPSSMAAAIASFGQLAAAHKVAIIGGMHELGRDEHKEHQRLVEQLMVCGLEKCYLVGSEFDGIDLTEGMRRFADTDELHAYFVKSPLAGATILVKGSNTNRLWTLEDVL